MSRVILIILANVYRVFVIKKKKGYPKIAPEGVVIGKLLSEKGMASKL
jgi:hypothetical protein